MGLGELKTPEKYFKINSKTVGHIKTDNYICGVMAHFNIMGLKFYIEGNFKAKTKNEHCLSNILKHEHTMINKVYTYFDYLSGLRLSIKQVRVILDCSRATACRKLAEIKVAYNKPKKRGVITVEDLCAYTGMTLQNVAGRLNGPPKP